MEFRNCQKRWLLFLLEENKINVKNLSSWPDLNKSIFITHIYYAEWAGGYLKCCFLEGLAHDLTEATRSAGSTWSCAAHLAGRAGSCTSLRGCWSRSLHNRYMQLDSNVFVFMISNRSDTQPDSKTRGGVPLQFNLGPMSMWTCKRLKVNKCLGIGPKKKKKKSQASSLFPSAACYWELKVLEIMKERIEQRETPLLEDNPCWKSRISTDFRETEMVLKKKNMSLVCKMIYSRLTLRKRWHIPNPNHFYKFSNTTIVTHLTKSLQNLLNYSGIMRVQRILKSQYFHIQTSKFEPFVIVLKKEKRQNRGRSRRNVGLTCRRNPLCSNHSQSRSRWRKEKDAESREKMLPSSYWLLADRGGCPCKRTKRQHSRMKHWTFSDFSFDCSCG